MGLLGPAMTHSRRAPGAEAATLNRALKTTPYTSGPPCHQQKFTPPLFKQYHSALTHLWAEARGRREAKGLPLGPEELLRSTAYRTIYKK